MAAASNRAARLTKLVSDLKKRYKPTAPPQRPLFETILFATLLENSPPDAANKAFSDIESSYYDWNEVRVSSRSELGEHMKPLTDPKESADRLKRTVQAIFETFYKFDLEELKKQQGFLNDPSHANLNNPELRKIIERLKDNNPNLPAEQAEAVKRMLQQPPDLKPAAPQSGGGPNRLCRNAPL